MEPTTRVELVTCRLRIHESECLQPNLIFFKPANDTRVPQFTPHSILGTLSGQCPDMKSTLRNPDRGAKPFKLSFAAVHFLGKPSGERLLDYECNHQ